MPIEIKELVIKTTVQEPKPQASSPESGGETPAMEYIVAECVEQVMEILKEKEER